MLRVQGGELGLGHDQEDDREDAIAVDVPAASGMPMAGSGYHDGPSLASMRRAEAWRGMQKELRIASLWYADDIVLVGDSAEELQSLLDVLSEECARWRILLNAGKTCVMVTNATLKYRHLQRARAAAPAAISTSVKQDAAQAVEGAQFHYRGAVLASVETYTYLGIVLQADYQWTQHKLLSWQRHGQRCTC